MNSIKNREKFHNKKKAKKKHSVKKIKKKHVYSYLHRFLRVNVSYQLDFLVERDVMEFLYKLIIKGNEIK